MTSSSLLDCTASRYTHNRATKLGYRTHPGAKLTSPVVALQNSDGSGVGDRGSSQEVTTQAALPACDLGDGQQVAVTGTSGCLSD